MKYPGIVHHRLPSVKRLLCLDFLEFLGYDLTMKHEPDYVLYILMRNDLDSLNPGKAIAQGAHAANQFWSRYGTEEACVSWAEQADSESGEMPPLFPIGFGTTIVLGMDGSSLIDMIINCEDKGYCSDTVIDPSYPIRDGQVTHLIPLMTCGYVFGDRAELESLLGQLELYP